MARIVILGAGLTGLSTAYHLEQQGFYDYIMVDKEASVGGLCRTIQQDGFTFDYTGHLLHVSDPYFRSLIDRIIGFEHFNPITRRSFVYSQGVYTRYPFQSNLYGLNTQTIGECIEGFVLRKASKKKTPSFYEWVLEQFGAGFGKHFFFPFQEKIFAHTIHDITASWTGRFVPTTSLPQIIQGAMTDNGDEPIGYNAQFFYPHQGGTFFWINKLAEQLHNRSMLNCSVQSINLSTKTVSFANGHTQPYTHLVNTIPLDTFLRCIIDKPTTSLRRAASWLRCNSVINFNLGIAHPRISDKHWIYFPEQHFPFYRLGFPGNFASTTTPPGCSSLYGEFSYQHKDKAWIATTLNQALTHTKKLLHINDSDILTQKIIPISHAYVIYDFWREKNLPSLLTRLAQESIFCSGRYGQWKYASMQEAVLDGKTMANFLLEKEGHVIPALTTQHEVLQ